MIFFVTIFFSLFPVSDNPVFFGQKCLVSQYNYIKALLEPIEALLRRHLGSVKALSRGSLIRAYKALFVKALFRLY